MNLAWSAALCIRLLRNPERWQTLDLPVYAVWAAIVVIVFPVVCGYM